MEGSSLFEVDQAISPKKGELRKLQRNFDKYDLVVVDYNGDNWNETMKSDFENYVNGGGGVVIYHGANNAFTDWKEFNEMTALGGWGGRKQDAGVWVYIEDGKIIKDGSDGKSGAHGPRHDYVLKCYDDKHPITKGMPKEWLQGNDELYDYMRGPGDIKSILYTAYADPMKRGSGREVPMIFTVEYGKGRIFHT